MPAVLLLLGGLTAVPDATLLLLLLLLPVAVATGWR
jgi:hypothetical protein